MGLVAASFLLEMVVLVTHGGSLALEHKSEQDGKRVSTVMNLNQMSRPETKRHN